MALAARMQRALERGALEDGISTQHGDHDEGGDAAAHLAAIDEVMRAAEREETWPRFINVLRARGPELRERMLRLVDSSAPTREREARARQRLLLARLADVGLGEEQQSLVDHAQYVMGSARGFSYLLDEYDPEELTLVPEAREHVLAGENAVWMYTFALVLLGRVASGLVEVDRPSTELAVTLAVEAARDAGAHWSTALELLDEILDQARPRNVQCNEDW